MTKTWDANPYTIERLYLSLDDELKAQLESNGCSLFRLLKLPSSCILAPLVDIFLSYYDSTQNVFIFGSHRLRITLEDVLFITGLPISGKPVIGSNSRGTDAFRRVFGCCSRSGSLSMSNLMFCAKNKGLDNYMRMIAVLLYVIYCFIIPVTSERRRQVKTTYVELLEKLVEVDSYAWGAALLAFLYTGIKKWKDDAYNGRTISSTFGNAWVLLCFFFIRIPSLMSAVGDELPLDDIPLQESLVDWIVEKLRVISKKPKDNYKENVVNILNNLSHEDIRWLPYDSSWLPPHLQDQYRFRALVAPLFCNNYVVHHRPQLVPKQFGLTEGSLAGFERYDYEIKIQGPDNPDYKTLYKKEIELWEEGKQLQDFISGKRYADVAEASSPPRKKSKLDVFHEEIALELAEKLGTLTARLSKEENEEKIRLLELKIKNSEAREEKLSSELRAARERIESSEAREEKLMSEGRVTLERNEELEGEIKSSEAREEKLSSELRAARERIESMEAREKKLMSEVKVTLERNVELEGKIKSSEAREEKLSSELRAARERIESLKAREKKLMSEVRVTLERNGELEGKIKSLEAREEKLSSELRVALEMIESVETREKKLMSEVRITLERNVLLEGVIKSSEAREKKFMYEAGVAQETNVKLHKSLEKLNSELSAARERNVKLEGEITSLEDREKKLESEVRAAVERNEILQGEIKSSEAGQKKLMSEVRVSVERNVKLTDKIKSSEAREEKLNSELSAARERNVKLEGEITRLEDREKKLKSEARAAVERTEILQGEIESSEGDQKKLIFEVRVVLERYVKLKDKIKHSKAREEKLKSELRTVVQRNLKLEADIKHAVSSLANLVNH